MISLQDVWDAKLKIRERIHYTGIVRSAALGEITGSEIYLKTENLQKTGSFKVRGAFNNVLRLAAEERALGLVTFSSGNHAQAVAYAAGVEGISVKIVMPVWAVPGKIEATRGYGAEVVLHGETSADIFAKALEIREDENRALIHPFDDLVTIAGQGTLGLEIMEVIPDADTIFVPIGGGGLIAGVALAAKSMSRRVRVIGVEPEGSCSMLASRRAGRITVLTECRSIADGLLVKEPGSHNYALVERYVDDIITVADADIKKDLIFLLERTKLLVEPSGVVALTGLLGGKARLGRKNVAVLSGGNCALESVKTMITGRLNSSAGSNTR